MVSQIDAMTMALEIVRVPLQKFEQSLDDRQRARLSAGVASEDAAPVCAKSLEPANWPMPILQQALQPTAAQEAALNNLERAFNRAASGLNAKCSDRMPRMPSARLQAIEARLDVTWVAVQTIQVAVAQFLKQLSDQQRARFTPFSLLQRHSSDAVFQSHSTLPFTHSIKAERAKTATVESKPRVTVSVCVGSSIPGGVRSHQLAKDLLSS